MPGPQDTSWGLYPVRLSTLFRYAILTLILSCLPATAMASEQIDQTYLTDLIRRASEAHLAEDRYWHLLLHYRKNLISGYTSEADDPGFFLASDGKTNPKAELEATLTQFFSRELVGRSRQP